LLVDDEVKEQQKAHCGAICKLLPKIKPTLSAFVATLFMEWPSAANQLGAAR